MTQLEKVLYTGKTHTSGGRDGVSRSADGRLDIKLSSPGSAGAGTNPEQMFAELVAIAKERIENEPLRQLVIDLLEEHREQLLVLPAATRNHHAFVSGFLEHVLNVRLLDRGRRGVEPTVYGTALLKSGRAAFEDGQLREISLASTSVTDFTSGWRRISTGILLRPDRR